MIRILRALAAAVTLLLLLIGIPAAFWVLGRESLPTQLPSWEQVVSTLAHPLTANFLLGLLTLTGMLAWATFLVAVLIEIPNALGRRPIRPVRGLGTPRRLAAMLLAAIFLTGITAPGLAPGAHASTGHDPAAELVHTAPAIDVPTTPGPTRTDQEQQPGEVHTMWQTHTVEPGDTLWDIAQSRLGHGTRWREIAELNTGLPQPDGRTLTEAHWLEPGWQLRIPGTERLRSETAQGQALEVRVQPGDTLYDLAAEHLGNGMRYPEILEASRHLRQPGNVQISDPDVIDVGWRLLIPSTTEPTRPIDEAADEMTGTGPHEERAPTGADRAEDSTPTHTRSDLSESTASYEAFSGRQADSATPGPTTGSTHQADEAGVLQRTAGGAGALLAAGIVAAIMLRRQRTHRTRPAGTRVATPAPGSPEDAVEQNLQVVANSEARARANLALRDLAAQSHNLGLPLPQIRAARLASNASELQLYLEAPADLPSPWRSSTDRRVWLISDEDLAAEVIPRSDSGDIPAPWPALASIGQDEENAHLLLDLEHLGQLDIRGPAEAAQATLAALAVELATSDFADDLQVTLVGLLPELVEAIDTSRIRYNPDLEPVLDSLEARARHLREHTTTPRHGPAPWPPEILIIGTDIDHSLRTRVANLVGTLPHVGIGAITREAHTGEWALEIEPAHPSEATLQPAGLSLRPQQLSTAEYTAILNVLAGAERYTAGPDWAQTLSSVTEPELADFPAADDAEQTPSDSGQVAEPEPALLEDSTPIVRLLGDVDITGIDESVLSGTPTHLSQAVEMIAYLVLNPGATTDEVTTDLWPDREAKASTRQSAISRARRLLGTDDAGEPYLSLSGNDPLGNNAYHVLPQVRSDWDRFNQLRGGDPTTAPLEDLRQALLLVRGTPFCRVREGRGRVRANRYLWADSFAREMIASIVDIACETARRALLEGKPKLAAAAASAGLRATGDEERTWRYAIRAHIQLGDYATVDALVAGLTAQLTELDADPERETNDLLDQLQTLTRRAAG